jgi:hypothetical protein
MKKLNFNKDLKKFKKILTQLEYPYYIQKGEVDNRQPVQIYIDTFAVFRRINVDNVSTTIAINMMGQLLIGYTVAFGGEFTNYECYGFRRISNDDLPYILNYLRDICDLEILTKIEKELR